MSTWREVALRELGELNRGKSKHRPRNAPELFGGPYPFVQTGDVKAARGRVTSFNQTYSELGLAQSRLWPAETVVVTIAANIAETAILSFPACFPDSVVGFIADRRKADPRFVAYIFQILRSSLQGEHVGTGSVQDNINLGILNELRVNVPALAEQQMIVGVLGALDDKIELNRRMNETLEGMAQAVFRDWFVDFGPTRRKLAGVTDSALIMGGLIASAVHSAALAALFPATLGGNGLPEGWVESELGQLTSELRRGISPSYVEADGVRVLNQKCIRNRQVNFDPARRHNPEKRSIDGRELMLGDLLVNSTGVGTLGRVAQLWELPETTVVDSHVTVVRANANQISKIYLGLNLTGREAEVEALGEGSTGQTELSRARLATLAVLAPPLAVQAEFDKLAKPLIDRMTAARRESVTLAATRDLLLPKLMSGEIRLAAAEAMVGAAT
jgi:type I restriction enzyme, S subunit